MLDRKSISPIIYIWYEGGWLSPPVVTAKRSSEAESLILRRRQWRRRQPRAPRRRPRKSGRSSKQGFGGAHTGHPIFFVRLRHGSGATAAEHELRRRSLILTNCCTLHECLRSEVADTRADVPGGRVRRLLRRDARAIQTTTVEGGDSDGEESQGLEEEGREEEITALLLHPGSLRRSDPIPDPHPLNHVPLRNPIDHLHPVHHRSENRVTSVQMRLR